MKKLVSSYLIIFVLPVLSLLSCQHQLNDDKDLQEVCFEADVLPIFQTSCGKCHNANATGEAAELNYTNYESIMQSITPGNADKSKAYESIIALAGEEQMPPDQPLSVAARSIIRVWINQGAKNTSCIESNAQNNDNPTDPTLSRACFSRDILPILRSSCATTGCHDAQSHKDGLTLTSYANVMSGNELVVRNNASASELYEVLINRGEDQMPPSSPLTAEKIALFKEWINNGAKEEECATLCDTTVFSYANAISGIISTNCTGCHGSTAPYGNVSLTNYSQVKAIANDGRLWSTINALNGKPLMPTGGKLEDCKITQIKKWLADGAPNN